MSDIELSPYHRALLQDLIDYEAMRRSLDAYERISGVPADEALVHLDGMSGPPLDGPGASLAS